MPTSTICLRVNCFLGEALLGEDNVLLMTVGGVLMTISA
jgi:hypothetical protein